MTTRPFDQWTHDNPDDRPADVALGMILDGVPRGSIVAYLHLATVLESGVDPWDATTRPDPPTTRPDR